LPAFHANTGEGVLPEAERLFTHVPKFVRCVPLNFAIAFLPAQLPLLEGMPLHAKDCQASLNWLSYLLLSIRSDFKPLFT